MATKKATENTVERITLPAMKFERITVRLVGTSILVTHPFPYKSMVEIAIKQNDPDPKGKKKEYDTRYPYSDCLQSCYVLSELPKSISQFNVDWSNPRGFLKPESVTKEIWEKIANTGRFGFHVGGIKNAIADTAYDLKLIKKKDVIYGSVFFKNAEKDMIYGIDCISLINNTPPIMRTDCLSTFNSGADMRYRPQFDKWEFDLIIDFNTDMIDKQSLIQLLNIAGTMKGLCEYRPQKGGSWGTFEVATG